MNSKVLTVIDVAELLALSPMTVYRLAKKGEIPAIKVGRCWRFTKEAIENWLAGKGWEGQLERLMNKVWCRTEKISEEKINKEIKKAVLEVRASAKNRS